LYVVAVTAEVASSSLVVPAIHSQKVCTDFAQAIEDAKRARVAAFLRPLFALFSSGDG
jgi:hypothetical protein